MQSTCGHSGIGEVAQETARNIGNEVITLLRTFDVTMTMSSHAFKTETIR